MEEDENAKKFECIVRTGRLFLYNGSEIIRVEQAIQQVCHALRFGIVTPYVLSNGIFISGKDSAGKDYSRVIHVPHTSTNLWKIEEMDTYIKTLDGTASADAVLSRIGQIEEGHTYRPLTSILCSAVGSGTFAVLLGGRLRETLAATLIGGALWVVVLALQKTHLSKNGISLLGGMLVAFLASLFQRAGFIPDVTTVIVGANIPLIPGMLLINSIFDLSNSDFVSGSIRILDAIVVTFFIALGVGIVLNVGRIL